MYTMINNTFGYGAILGELGLWHSIVTIHRTLSVFNLAIPCVSYKDNNISKNVKGCRDGHAKKHSNKV